MSAISGPDRQEQGSALILALAFMVAIGLVILSLATFASSAMLNTSNSHAQRTALNDAEAATVTAMQYLRTNFVSISMYNGGQLPNGQTTQTCLPGAAGGESASVLPSSDPRRAGQGNSVYLACVANYNVGSPATRVVDFYACQPGTSANYYSVCTAPGSSKVILHAQVTYDDYPASGPIDCGPNSGQTTCGTGMTVNAWDVATADS
jgi:hypothetical protein